MSAKKLGVQINGAPISGCISSIFVNILFVHLEKKIWLKKGLVKISSTFNILYVDDTSIYSRHEDYIRNVLDFFNSQRQCIDFSMQVQIIISYLHLIN